jgi:drug/metabolite transporter (DMT)-like permease
MQQRDSKLAYVHACIAILLWASTPAIAKLLLRDMSNLDVLLYTSFFAAATLFIVVICQGKARLLLNCKAADYWHFTWTGLLGIFLYQMLFYEGLSLSSALEAFIMNYTWPLWIVIFAVPLLGQRFTRRKVISITLAFAGVICVAGRGAFRFQEAHWRGDALCLVGAACFGLFCVINKKRNDEKFTSMLFCFLATFVATLLVQVSAHRLALMRGPQLCGLFWLGVFPGGLAFTFWSLALEHGNTTRMATLVFLTPFMSLAYIYFLLGETARPSALLGLALVVAGFLVQVRDK